MKNGICPVCGSPMKKFDNFQSPAVYCTNDGCNYWRVDILSANDIVLIALACLVFLGFMVFGPF